MRYRTPDWYLTVVIGVASLLAGPGFSAAQAPAPESVPTPAVIAAWQQAGAVFGWSSIGPEGDWRFDHDRPSPDALPAFRWSKFPAGKLEALVPPDFPFGLWLGRSVKDADLQELAGLKQLRALNFEDTYTSGVTDVGLKKLAALPRLQALSLYHTGQTDERQQLLRGVRVALFHFAQDARHLAHRRHRLRDSD